MCAGGMALPGRSYNAGNSSYKYGFNGKEDDKDISPGGQDYGMRIYDKRVCRFLSVDPITKDYPELTPYQFASDEPLSNIDLDGLEKANATKSKLWGSDYTGFIQNATPEQREEHPIKAFIKDFSADILNVIGPGQVDNNIATLNDKNASTFDKVVAVFDLGFSLEPFKPETEKPETPTKSPTTSVPVIKISPENQISRKLLNAPKKSGNAPTFKSDGTSVEIHHVGQNPEGPFVELHKENHRGKGTDKVNHPDKGQKSKIDRKSFNKAKAQYWKKEFKIENLNRNQRK